MDKRKEKILIAREFRAKQIYKIVEKDIAVVSLKANIPGDKKNITEAYVLVNTFFPLLNETSDGYSFYESDDGPYYLFEYKNKEADKIKKSTMDLEENHPLGRMVDIDVHTRNRQLSRDTKRKCMLCDDLAFNCIRSKKHSLEETLNHIRNSVETYFKNRVENLIVGSIFLELDLHPKFGMVTPYTNGSHKDMNYKLMVKAIDAIVPWLMEMYDYSRKTKDINKLFPGIREIGQKAEKAMFNATGNINAYKGLIFNLGLFVSAFGFKVFSSRIDLDIYEIIRYMTKDILQDYDKNNTSYGFEAYEKYGILGARGEAINGFPHVKKALEYLTDFSDRSRLVTLAYLITEIEDTNLLKRSGSIEEYKSNRERFKAILKYDQDKINQLDEYCLEHNLSFGGSADLLIVTIFMKKLNSFYKL